MRFTKEARLIDLSKVRSVYSGKPGCCCGCLGKHTYALEMIRKDQGVIDWYDGHFFSYVSIHFPHKTYIAYFA